LSLLELDSLEKFGCSKQSVGLVLPTGYAFNLDGTSIYMSLCVLFIVNAYGVPLSWDQQLGILALMLLTSKGAATVNGGNFVVFAATVSAIGVLPVEGLALIFGVYRFMSMASAICTPLGIAWRPSWCRDGRESFPNRRRRLNMNARLAGCRMRRFDSLRRGPGCPT
jgi:Na+/H+-dicarboxylate symporter